MTTVITLWNAEKQNDHYTLAFTGKVMGRT